MWLFCPLFLNGSTFQAQWSAKPKSQPDNARPTHLISTLPSLFSDILLQFSSVTQSCPTLCNPMNHSRPGLPVHHQLPGFTQTHAHWVGDAIQPSHPLSFPSPPIFNLSQHQGFFFQMSRCFTQGGQSIWVSASTSVLPMNTQNWFPSWFPDILLNSNEIMCCSVQDNMRCHPSTYPKCFFLFSSLTIIRQPDLTFIWEPTIITASFWKLSFPGGSAGKESACNEGDLGYLPGLGRFLGERKAIHSSILAWRGPWTV